MSAEASGKSVQAGRLILEVRQCAVCLGPVVYWQGQFRHLTLECSSSPALELREQLKQLVVTLRRVSGWQEASGHPEGAYATGCAATMVEALDGG